VAQVEVPAPPPAGAPAAGPAPASRTDLPQTLVVPLRIPRSALGTSGASRIILELHIEDR
jgi:hypothetical protein